MRIFLTDGIDVSENEFFFLYFQPGYADGSLKRYKNKKIGKLPPNNS